MSRLGGKGAGNRSPGFGKGILTVVLLLVSVAACIVFVLSYPLPEVRYDAAEYLSLARNVAAGKGFTEDGITPAVYRPPLFSLLLGGWFKMTGTSSPLSAAVFQSFLHALGVAAAFSLFLGLAVPPPWAFAGALFLAVNPLLVTRVAFVLQEPALLLFTTLAVLATVRLVLGPSPFRAAIAGAAWGASTLGKIVCWYAPFLLLAMRFLPSRLRWDCRRKEAALLLLFFVAVIAPWTVRNYVHFHRFIPVNGQGEGILDWNVSYAEPPGALPGRELTADLDRRGVTGERRVAAMGRYVQGNLRYFLVDRTVHNALQFASPARDWWWSRGRLGPDEPRPWYWTIHDYGFRILYLFFAYRTVLWVTGNIGISLGFMILFYWAYWIEHALVLGTPRFSLVVYPLLIAMLLPQGEPGRIPSGPEMAGPSLREQV